MTRRINRFSALESLESRRLLSGVVTATLNNGALLIKGDGGGNNIEIDGTGGVLTISPVGATAVAFPNVFPAAAIFNIRVELGDGSDSAFIHDINQADGFNLFSPVGLSVKDDKGNDQYVLQDNDLDITPLTVATGGGTDVTIIDTCDFSSMNLTTSGSNASFDQIVLDTVFAGQTTIETGNVQDFLSLDSVTIVGALSMKTGEGNDSITMGAFSGSVLVTGNITIDSGKGDDAIRLGDAGGGLSVTTFSNLNIKASDGFDLVNLQNTTAQNNNGGVSVVDGGGQNDLLHLEGTIFGFTVKGFEGVF